MAEGSRRIVFVAGAGRSGTSTLSGALQHLGMCVPRPEVQPDLTNPKGFAESQWVVDFHDDLLRRARVLISDARPQAWFEAGKLGLREQPRNRLDEWLKSQFAEADELVIKDPRLAWFLGLWRVSAVRSGAVPVVVTMLRPPTQVVSSRERYYRGAQGNASRTAAWVNMMLHTERATRDCERAFLRYHDLVADWTTAIFQLGETFDLQAVKNATTADISRVHDFIDPSLNRMGGTWEDLEVPHRLSDLAERTWGQLSRLADVDHDAPGVTGALDELRQEYTQLYADSEAIARSSITVERMFPPVPNERSTAREKKARSAAREAARSAAGAEDPLPAQNEVVTAQKGRTQSPESEQTVADRVASRVPHSVRSSIPAGLRRQGRALLNGLRGQR